MSSISAFIAVCCCRTRSCSERNISFAFPINRAKSTVKQGKVSGLIGIVYGFWRTLDRYYRLPVTILFEKIICWPLNRGKKAVNNNLATAKRWPRSLNRGGRRIEVSNTAV